MFNERDVQFILGTSLSHCELQDEITWALTKDGCYSMKNAYMLRKGGNPDLFIKLGSIFGAWKLAQRYVILFLAHMSLSLPDRALLKQRHMIDGDLCLWGYGIPKKSTHVIFTCPRWVDMWRESGCEALSSVDDGTGICDLLAVSW